MTSFLALRASVCAYLWCLIPSVCYIGFEWRPLSHLQRFHAGYLSASGRSPVRNLLDPYIIIRGGHLGGGASPRSRLSSRPNHTLPCVPAGTPCCTGAVRAGRQRPHSSNGKASSPHTAHWQAGTRGTHSPSSRLALVCHQSGAPPGHRPFATCPVGAHCLRQYASRLAIRPPPLPSGLILESRR